MLDNLITNVTDKIIQLRGFLEKNSDNVRNLVSEVVDVLDTVPDLFKVRAGETLSFISDMTVTEYCNTIKPVFDLISSKFATMVDSTGKLFSPVLKYIEYVPGVVDELQIGCVNDQNLFKSWIDIDKLNSEFTLTAHDFVNSFGEKLSFDNLTDLFGNVMDTVGISTVITEATDLFERGELTASNFIQVCSDRIGSANGAVANAYSTLLSAIKRSDNASIAVNLLGSIKDIVGGWTRARASSDNTSIEFASTDYFVSSSIFFDISSVVSLATNVLTVITSFISPIIGFIVQGVGAGVQRVIEFINNNDGHLCKYVDPSEADGYNLAIPVYQKVFNTADIQYLNQNVLDNLNHYGFCRTNNNFLTVYYWIDAVNDSGQITSVKAEGYVSSLSSSLIGDDQPLWTNHVLNAVSVSESTGATVTTYQQDRDKYNLQILLNQWGIIDQTHPDYVTYIDKGYNEDSRSYIDFRHMRTVEDNLASLAYMVLNSTEGHLTGVSSNRPYSEYTDAFANYPLVDVNFVPEQFSSSATASTAAIWLLLLFLNRYKTDRSTTYWSINNDTGLTPEQYVSREWKSLVNWTIPALRYMLSSYAWQYSIASGASEIFSIWFTSYDSGIADDTLGNGYQFRILNPRTCDRNQYLYPPSCTVSVWVKLAVAAIATAAIVTAIAVAALKVKRWIRYKTEVYKANLKIEPKELSQMSFKEFSDYRSQCRFYNKFLGRLSGSTFDVGNQWFDSVDGAGSENGTVLDTIIGFASNNEENENTVSLADVMRIIRGSLS